MRLPIGGGTATMVRRHLKTGDLGFDPGPSLARARLPNVSILGIRSYVKPGSLARRPAFWKSVLGLVGQMSIYRDWAK